MIGALKKEAGVLQYELEIEIDAAPERVWSTMIDDTNAWWLPDFHVAGADSKVTFDARAGGLLVEELPGGGGLLWYTVQWFDPAGMTVYLVGQLSPEYGGPSTSSMKLVVEARGDGSVLKITDAHHGNIDEQTLAGQKDGWNTLFTDGLKKFVEGR